MLKCSSLCHSQDYGSATGFRQGQGEVILKTRRCPCSWSLFLMTPIFIQRKSKVLWNLASITLMDLAERSWTRWWIAFEIPGNSLPKIWLKRLYEYIYIYIYIYIMLLGIFLINKMCSILLTEHMQIEDSVDFQFLTCNSHQASLTLCLRSPNLDISIYLCEGGLKIYWLKSPYNAVISDKSRIEQLNSSVKLVYMDRKVYDIEKYTSFGQISRKHLVSLWTFQPTLIYVYIYIYIYVGIIYLWSNEHYIYSIPGRMLLTESIKNSEL